MSGADQWTWWRGALAGTPTPINADEPGAGFYETRSKNKQSGEITRSVIAYWYAPDGSLYCKSGFGATSRMVPDLTARERWPYASKRPITKETYDAVCKSGRWPDESEAAAADRARTSDGKRRPNSDAAPDQDSIEGIAERISDLAREAEKIVAAGAAKTKAESDQAADLADRLLKLEKSADLKRRTAMQPHEERAQEEDRKWRPLRDRAAALKADLKNRVVTPFLIAARDQARAETATAAATGAAIPAQSRGKGPSAGTSGRVSLRETKAARIVDYTKTLAFFANHEHVRALVQQLSNASVRAGITPDGCEVDTTSAAA
jgi:hypothetical protein